MRRTLRGRIVAAFTGFALLVALVFGFATTVFLYETEDRLFDMLLAEEAAYQEAAFRGTGRWATPRHPWMSVHATAATLPADLRAALASRPTGREFAGEAGRHYHLRALRVGTATGEARVVAEVSGQLVLRRHRRGLATTWLALEGVILAVAIGVALVLARRIARPLSSLAESVRALDPAGPWPALPATPRDAEVATVSAAIHELRTRIAGFVEREQAFTRDASHELRTPLAVVRSTTAQLLDDPSLPPATRHGLERVAQACARLEWTVRSLLELAREPMPLTAATAVRPVLEDVVLEAAEALRASGLTVVIELPPDVTLRTPPAALRLVLSGIVANACTHASPGVLHVRASGAALEVRNPVDPLTLPDPARLGTPGVRRDDSPGLGLGLQIGRRLCERSGLTLRVAADDGVFVVRIA